MGNGWTIFAWIDQTMQALITAASQQMVQQTLAYARSVIIAATTLYIGITTSADLLGLTGEHGAIMRRLVRAAVVVGLVVSTAWSADIALFLARDWPNELVGVVTAPGIPVHTGAAAFDSLLSQQWISLCEIWQNTSGWSLKSGAILFVAAAMFLPSALIIACVAFAYFAAKFGLAVLVGVGALFLATLLHPKTATIFEGWAGVVLGLLVELVLLTGLLSMVLYLETQLMTNLLGTNSATGANKDDVAGQLHWQVGGLVAIVLAALFAYKSSMWAARITGGVANGIAAFAQTASGALASGAQTAAAAGGRLASAAGSAINGGGMGGASAAGMRRVVPPGRAP